MNTVIYYAALRGIDYLAEAVTVEAEAAPAKTETKPSAAAAAPAKKEAAPAKKAEEEVDEDDLFGGVDEEELAAEKKRREDEKKHKKKAEEIQRSNMYVQFFRSLLAHLLYAPSNFRACAQCGLCLLSGHRYKEIKQSIEAMGSAFPRSCVFVTVNLQKQRDNLFAVSCVSL
jgi:hypothetical protein